MTWQANLLTNYNFSDDASGWILSSIASRDITEVLENNISIKLESTDKVSDSAEGLISDKLLVRPDEIYSASVFCRTSDYLLFDGTDPQIEVELLGYETTSGASTQLGYASVDKADFPAQDYFRIKIENEIIPSNIHYISLSIKMKRNGKCWINYPCIEYGATVTDYNPYNTDLMSYYNKCIYENILEIQELVRAQNIEFDRVNRLTEKTTNNFYILTCDLDGIIKYEKDFGIIPNPLVEDIDFRRARILNRMSILIPYTFPFLYNKLNELLGVGNWDAYIDFNNYTLYIEYAPITSSWDREIQILVTGIKPCNMIFVSLPTITHRILISESVNRTKTNFNYILGEWELGAKTFADCTNNYVLDGSFILDGSKPITTYGTEEEIKMPSTPSVQAKLLNYVATEIKDVTYKIVVSDGTTDYEPSGITKSVVGNLTTIQYEIPTSSGLTQVTSIKLYDSSDNLLTSSPVFIQLNTDVIVTDKFTTAEGVA